MIFISSCLCIFLYPLIKWKYTNWPEFSQLMVFIRIVLTNLHWINLFWTTSPNFKDRNNFKRPLFLKVMFLCHCNFFRQMEIILNYCCKGENSTILIPSLSSDFPFISSRIGNKTVIPALGLAWSSMVTTRLMLSRTEQLTQLNDGVSPWFYQNHFYHLKMRNFLSVSFAAVVLWERESMCCDKTKQQLQRRQSFWNSEIPA